MKSMTLPKTTLTRLAAVILLAILAMFASMTAASAHDELVSSTPKNGASLKEAPEKLTLEFSGELQSMSGVESTKVVLKQDGKEVETTAATKGKVVTVTPAKALEAGEYDLAFRVVSSDGHPVENKLTFTIDSATPTPSMVNAPSESAQPSETAQASESAQASDSAEASRNPVQAAGSSMSPVLWVVIGVVILGGVIAVLAKFMRNNK